jgi:trigger factor
VTVTKEIKRLEHSALELIITVGKDDVRSEYDDLIRQYGKTIQIPGFRKGKVPRDVMLKKFGDTFRGETLGKLVETAITKVFEDESFPVENRPLPYSSPRLKEDEKELELDLDRDLVFSVVYDALPQFTVGAWKGLEVEVPDAKLEDEDLNRELEVLRERNAIVLDRDDGAEAAQGDVVTVNYAEISDDGEIVPETERQDFVFTLGSGYNIFKFDDDITGMKKGETREIEKSYPEDFADKDLAGKTKKIRVTLTALKEKKLPDLDDDLAQDVDEKYKTLEDLKNDIRERLTRSLDGKLREIGISRILEKILETTTVDVPESMIRIELESRWRNMARQFNADPEELTRNMEKSGSGRESIFEGWRPDAVKALQGRIIVETLMKDLGFEAGEEELEKEFETMTKETGTSIDEVKKYYESDEMKDYLKESIKERKFFDLLLSENTVKKGNITKYLDLISNNG